jgi:tetratricopeptide (TPR) repeat protein
MTIRTAVVAVTVLLTASTVRAEVCPDNIPEDSATRRAQAKKWFTIGESAAGAGEDVAALKAYQCSLRFVSHGFTAYNIAQVAERVGDLELAIASYNQYLLLVPEAKDAQEVNERLESLKDRLAKARQREKAMAAMVAATVGGPAKGIEPPRAAGGVVAVGAHDQGSTPAGGSTTDARDGKTTESVADETPRSGSKYRTAAWIVYGGAGVMLVGGVIMNVLARGKMDTCNSKYNAIPRDLSGAQSACSDAKPLAYMSYGFLGLGAAAVAVGTVLVLRPTESSEVAVKPLPEGGLALGWGGRY